MRHSTFDQDAVRDGIKQERIDLNLPPAEARLPKVVNLLLAEANGDLEAGEVDEALEEMMVEMKALEAVSFDPGASVREIDTSFAEEDAYMAELGERAESEVPTAEYLALSTSEEDAAISISPEDLIISGLHFDGAWSRVNQGSLRHASTPDDLLLRTGHYDEDEAQGFTSWASDQAVQCRDLGF